MDIVSAKRETKQTIHKVRQREAKNVRIRIGLRDGGLLRVERWPIFVDK